MSQTSNFHFDPNLSEPKKSLLTEDKDSEIKIYIPLLHGIQTFRHIFREYLIKQINWSLELLPIIQRHESSFLYFYFRLFTFLGSEDFYWGVLPTIYWIFSPAIGRRFICLWAICVYVGDWLKNAFCLPRPPKAFIKGSQKKLDNHGFGWPSLHSIHAIALPFFAIRSCYGYVWDWSDEGVVREGGGILICWMLAILWMCSVCLSRLYLGVHSPGDVQGGLIIGGIILQFWSSFSEGFDYWLTTSPTGFIWIGICGVFLLSIIPHVSPLSSTDEEVNTLVCFMTGFLLSTNLFPDLLQRPQSEITLGLAISRFALGFVSLASMYLTLGFLWNYFMESPKPTVETKKTETEKETLKTETEKERIRQKDQEGEPKQKILEPVTFKRVCRMLLKYGIGCGGSIVVVAPLVFSYFGI